MSPRVLMVVWTGVASDTRVLREATSLVAAGATVHVVGRAVPADFVPPPGVTVSSVGRPPAAQTRARRLTPVERLGRWALLPDHVHRRLSAWQAAAVEEGRAHRADVVHAHDLSALPVGVALSSEWDVPLVYDSHELWSGRPREGRPAPLRARRDRRLEDALGDRADAVITVGDGVAEALRSAYPSWPAITVVRNTFPARRDLTPRTGPPTGLVYAGRLAAYRELEVVARASRSVDLPVTLVGPGDDQWVGSFDPGSATVLPAESLPAVDRRLTDAGLALVTHSDKWENHRLALPNKLFHAVSLGVPVVGTDVGELGRIVRAHGVGTLYRPGDAEDLARAVREAVASYDSLRAAVAASSDALTWQADERALLGVYARIGVPLAASILGRPVQNPELPEEGQ